MSDKNIKSQTYYYLNGCKIIFVSIHLNMLSMISMYLNSSADPVFQLKPNQLLDKLLYSSGDGLQYKLNILQHYYNECFLNIITS